MKRELMWAIHNMIGHPFLGLCSICSLFGRIRVIRDLGIWVHEITTPSRRR
jgi:hypothetical protein